MKIEEFDATVTKLSVQFEEHFSNLIAITEKIHSLEEEFSSLLDTNEVLQMDEIQHKIHGHLAYAITELGRIGYITHLLGTYLVDVGKMIKDVYYATVAKSTVDKAMKENSVYLRYQRAFLSKEWQYKTYDKHIQRITNGQILRASSLSIRKTQILTQ